jgi:hypothetical protein
MPWREKGVPGRFQAPPAPRHDQERVIAGPPVVREGMALSTLEPSEVMGIWPLWTVACANCRGGSAGLDPVIHPF